MDKIINLSITKKNVPVRVDVVQYATAPNIIFAFDDFMPQGTADIYIEKPSGMKVFSHLTIDDNMLTLVPTTQAFAEVGISKAQLLISDGTADAISFLIFFYVTENIIDSSAIESQDEFTALQEALNTVGQYDGRITALEGAVEDGVTTLAQNDLIEEAKSRAPSASYPIGLSVNSTKGNYTASFGVNHNLRLFDNGNNQVVWEHNIDTNEVVYDPNGSTALPSTAVTNETWTNIGSFTLPKAGTYLVMMTGRFDKNATGIRWVILSSESGSSSSLYNSVVDVRNAIPTAVTHMSIVHTIRATSERTIYVNAWQNSGSSLNFNPRLAVIRLS